MNNNFKNDISNENIELFDLVSALWQEKFIIFVFITISSLSSIFYALYLPDIYNSEAILSPVETDAGVGRSLQGYSGLASLAGISLPSSSGSKSEEAIEVLQSYKFFSNNFLPNIKLEDLMAIKSWDPVTNTSTYNNKEYDSSSKMWVRTVKFPQTQRPSAQESYEVFKEILSISTDKETGFVVINVKHQSPFVATSWINIMVNKINKEFRFNHKKESDLAIKYLNSQLLKTNLTEIKEALSQLLQNETQKLMLIEANEDYVFKVLEPPFPREYSSEPSRLFIVIFGMFIGVFVGIAVAFLKMLLKKSN